MADNHSGYWQSEYDWKAVPAETSPRDSRENVLCLLFEAGAQRQFSSVRITLCCKHDVPENGWKTWEVEMISNSGSSSSFNNFVPAEPRDGYVGSDSLTLPTYNAIFVVGYIPSLSSTLIDKGEVQGRLQLCDAGSLEASFHTFFEVVQPLTEETQSISVTFTSSQWISVLLPRSDMPSLQPQLDPSVATGRVVRVFPIHPTRNRKTITLPMDVLLVIFENIFDPTNPYWRRDLVSCGLVCRGWTCALAGNFLFSDFRSGSFEEGYPPEISSLAAALIARPDHGRFIKHISTRYLEKHSAWTDVFNDHSIILARFQRHPDVQHLERCSRFADAFISILRSASNVRILCLDSKASLNILYKLPKAVTLDLESLSLTEYFGEFGLPENTMRQVLSRISTWPSLRRITLSYMSLARVQEGTPSQPNEPMMSSLTAIDLAYSTVTDNDLMYLISSSSHSLQQLTLHCMWGLTNIGISSALHLVSKSLTHLFLVGQQCQPERGEERALDAVISHMERLELLWIHRSPKVASGLMIERRAYAFESSAERVLPVIHLRLFVHPAYGYNELVAAAGRDWPGWKITVHETIYP